MITLNDYFDKIYCINLDEATDRWNKCLEQFDKYNIEVERFPAVRPDEGLNGLLRGEIGVMRSNYQIIKKSKECGFKNVLIIEDDFEFVDNFNVLFDTLIRKVPDDWDFLYFGGNHLGGLYMINENIAKMFNTYALHTFSVKNTMYDLILNTLPDEKKQVDVYYGDMMKNCNAYVFRPHLSYQREGYSFIQGGFQNYDFLRN